MKFVFLPKRAISIEVKHPVICGKSEKSFVLFNSAVALVRDVMEIGFGDKIPD